MRASARVMRLRLAGIQVLRRVAHRPT
jgi:hypothetical protein